MRFVVAQAADATILEALSQADKAGFARPVLVGSGNEIRKAARERDVSLDGWDIAEAPTTVEAAAEAVRIVAKGQGDILVKGLIQTADLLHAVLNKTNGLTTGRTLSHVGVFRFPGSERLFFVTDAALSIAPDYHQKIDIVQNAVDVAHRLGVPQPIVAILCAIETVNPEDARYRGRGVPCQDGGTGGHPRGARRGPPCAGQRGKRGGCPAQRHYQRPGRSGRYPGGAEHRSCQYPVQSAHFLRKSRGSRHRHGSTMSHRAGLSKRLGEKQALFPGAGGADALRIKPCHCRSD